MAQFNPSEYIIKLPKNSRNKKTGKWETTYADYLEVKWRVVWFREEKPLWAIQTKHIEITEDRAIFKCIIEDETGRTVSTGYGSETQRDFGDFIEKAETKAIGRALAYLGYGTQFAPELDEEDRIVDAPVNKKHKTLYISTEQAKDLFTIAPEDIVIEALKTLGYKSSKEIKITDYQAVRKYIADLAETAKSKVS